MDKNQKITIFSFSLSLQVFLSHSGLILFVYWIKLLAATSVFNNRLVPGGWSRWALSFPTLQDSVKMEAETLPV